MQTLPMLTLCILFFSGCSSLKKVVSLNSGDTKFEQIREDIKNDNEAFQKQLESRIKLTIRNEIMPEMRELSTYSKNLQIRKTQNNIKDKVFKKTVIGRVEWIKTIDPEVRFRARVDTGAQTNSMHAESIKEIERDGAKYVEFTTAGADGKKITLLKKVLKETKVKSTSGVSSKRYVVQMEVILGGKKLSTNINLNNRKALRHNFLIGRNLLLGNFIIDVSQSRLLGE